MIDPSSQHQRAARHLAMLEELAGLAMALTRLAAEKAQRHLAEPEPNPEPGPDPVLAFTRLSHTVRQIIALETRIATPARTSNQLRPVDEPRELIAEAVRACAKADPAATRRHGPTRTHIERHIDERIDADDITNLIDENADLSDIIETICDDLGIRFDIAQQPDENLLPINEAVEHRRTANTPQNPPDAEDYDPEDDPDPPPPDE